MLVSNSYDAQYGRTSGGIINVSLKSGTNVPRGTLFESMRRSFLDAKDWIGTCTHTLPETRLITMVIRSGGGSAEVESLKNRSYERCVVAGC